MAMAVGGHDGGPSANINVTPLIDVLLVLLIIFMVITPMLQKGRSVELAKTNNPEQMPDADKEDAILIAVTRTNDVFLNNDKMTPDQLADK
ncbi:MAG TPA: biopolymer transporter ExbD, partial [Terriglobales bacterium]|nr:biopolymer transporter ExbD [Terriglobales bacterium]